MMQHNIQREEMQRGFWVYSDVHNFYLRDGSEHPIWKQASQVISWTWLLYIILVTQLKQTALMFCAWT